MRGRKQRRKQRRQSASNGRDAEAHGQACLLQVCSNFTLQVLTHTCNVSVLLKIHARLMRMHKAENNSNKVYRIEQPYLSTLVSPSIDHMPTHTDTGGPPMPTLVEEGTQPMQAPTQVMHMPTLPPPPPRPTTQQLSEQVKRLAQSELDK